MKHVTSDTEEDPYIIMNFQKGKNRTTTNRDKDPKAYKEDI